LLLVVVVVVRVTKEVELAVVLVVSVQMFRVNLLVAGVLPNPQ
jgi:hypothetical protein